MLLPDPTKYTKPSETTEIDEKQTVFFEHRDLDQIARHFIGNIHRFR